MFPITGGLTYLLLHNTLFRSIRIVSFRSGYAFPIGQSRCALHVIALGRLRESDFKSYWSH